MSTRDKRLFSLSLFVTHAARSRLFSRGRVLDLEHAFLSFARLVSSSRFRQSSAFSLASIRPHPARETHLVFTESRDQCFLAKSRSSAVVQRCISPSSVISRTGNACDSRKHLHLIIAIIDNPRSRGWRGSVLAEARGRAEAMFPSTRYR